MSDSQDKMLSYGANSMAIWASIVIQIIYVTAFAYAAANLGGDAAYVFWTLAVISGVGALATTIAKVIVDVAFGALRKVDSLAKK